MDQASVDQIRRLALYMKRRRLLKPPYVLLLGAGASIASGYPDGRGFVQQFLGRVGYNLAGLTDQDERAMFVREWLAAGPDNIDILVNEILPPVMPSLGYNAIAYLGLEKFLGIILTTNPDPLIEQAFIQGVRDPRQWEILVVGRDADERIRNRLNTGLFPVKIMKLHGDLVSGEFKFTQDEISEFSGSIKMIVQSLLNEDLIVVGHALQDPDLLECLSSQSSGVSKSMWYVSPDGASGEVSRLMERRGGELNIITEQFDAFFSRLAFELGSPQSLTDFSRDFVSGELSGLAVDVGRYGVSAGKFWIGTEGENSYCGLPSSLWKEAGTIEAEFLISDFGGDKSRWVGFLVKSWRKDWRSGYLVYYRANGSVEVLARGTEVIAKADVGIHGGDLVRTKINFGRDLIEVYVGDEGKSVIAVTDTDLRRPGGQVSVWAFGCRGEFRKLNVVDAVASENG